MTSGKFFTGHPLWVISLFFILASIVSFYACGCSVTQTKTRQPSVARDVPMHAYESFVFLERRITEISYEICSDKDSDICVDVQPELMGLDSAATYTASGVVVATNESNPNVQYVLTAGHFCVDAGDSLMQEAKQTDVDFTGVEYNEKLIASTSKKSVDFEVLAYSHDDTVDDLCIIKTRGLNAAEIPIADDDPKLGETVYNVSAPGSLWQPGIVFTFSGYYDGDYKCNHPSDDEPLNVFEYLNTEGCKEEHPLWSVYSIEVAQGSSGSPILNGKGEALGIISRIHMPGGMSHVGIAIATRRESVALLIERLKILDEAAFVAYHKFQESQSSPSSSSSSSSSTGTSGER